MNIDSPIRVAASSVPGFQDCARNWAVHHVKGFYTGTAEGAGEKDDRVHGVGALIGDAVHLAVQCMSADKYESGKWDTAEAIALGQEYWSSKWEGKHKVNIKTDEITGSKASGLIQIESLVCAMSRDFMPTVDPKWVEFKCKYQYSEQLSVRMKIDMATYASGRAAIYDYKFGGHELKNYNAQLGLGLLGMEQSAWFKGEVTGLFLVFAKRPRVKKLNFTQAPVMVIPINLIAAKNAALKQCAEIQRSTRDYRETGNLWAFNANPRSGLCYQGICKAWGSEDCDQWMNVKEEKENDGN